MAVGYLPAQRIRVPASGGWNSAFPFVTLSNGIEEPYSIAGFSIACTLTLANQTPAATPIDISSYFSVSGSTAQVAIPREVTADWALGDYDLHLRVIDPDSDEDVFVIYSDPLSSRVLVTA